MSIEPNQLLPRERTIEATAEAIAHVLNRELVPALLTLRKRFLARIYPVVTLHSVTTAERDAIAAVVDGMLIYNADTSKVQARAGGAWVDLH